MISILSVFNTMHTLFRCRHRHISRVFTDRDTGLSHIVCMDCCGRFAYDWSTMEIGAPVEAPLPKRWNAGLETQV
jgi:hypothetical protein